MELEELYRKHGLTLIKEECTPMAVALAAWLALTKTAENEAKEVTAALEDELRGGHKTGFAPYIKEVEVYFTQRRLFVMGKK